MKNNIKKVIAVHDISGYGRCSLAVVIPVLSTMGIQVCPIPTAVLSTQTDGFEDFTFKDLTDNIAPYFEHLSLQSDSVDAFYSGFLGSAEQIEIIRKMTLRVKGKMPVLIDPVMGDEGKLYSTYSEDMCYGMRHLVGNADVIVPNATEAAFLVGEEPKVSCSKADAEGLLRGLSKITSATIVITGIREGDVISSAISTDGGVTVNFVDNKLLPCHYPGTGDIFASVTLGCMLGGRTVFDAVTASSGFVRELMEYSSRFDYPPREGVLLEAKLGELCKL